MAFVRKNRPKPEYIPIGIDHEKGGTLIATGNCSLELVTDYLKTEECFEFLESDIYQELKKYKSFSILRSVYSDYYGQGIGKDMINQYLSENTDECLILVADVSGGAEWWLIEYYEKFGYKMVSNDDLPVMIKTI